MNVLYLIFFHFVNRSHVSTALPSSYSWIEDDEDKLEQYCLVVFLLGTCLDSWHLCLWFHAQQENQGSEMERGFHEWKEIFINGNVISINGEGFYELKGFFKEKRSSTNEWFTQTKHGNHRQTRSTRSILFALYHLIKT